MVHPVSDTAERPDDWYVSFNASMSFFGLATFSANGMFDYAGPVRVSLSGDLLLGTHDFGLEGTLQHRRQPLVR